MLMSIRVCQRNILRLRRSRKSFTRTFLSDSYSCTDAWQRRYESPLLSKINPRDMYVELDQNFQTKKRASAVDVDIFANTLKEPDYNDELVHIVHQLRQSVEATNILDSTHHAVIRFLHENGHDTLLLDILNDRINYGIFPDYLLYNLLMDNYMKRNEFASAAKIATLLMLQEDSEHPITNALVVYSCYKYLEKPEDWLPPAPEPEEEGEPIKIRVGYLRNPFFDDHFDIKEPKLLVGKTLMFFGKLADNPVERTSLLRGYVLWQKYDRAAKLLKTWIDGNIKEIIYKEALPWIEKELAEIPEDKITDDIKELKVLMEKLANCSLKEGNIVEELEKRVKAAVAENEATDITKQCQIYEDWEKYRMDVLNKQIDELDREERIKNVQSMKDDLVKRERLLTFFEHEEQIELSIQKKLEHEEQKYGPPVQIESDIAENYIPPEITRQPMPGKH